MAWPGDRDNLQQLVEQRTPSGVDDVGFNGADFRRREAVGAREALKSRPRATRAGRLGSHSRICRNWASARRYPSCPPARPRAPRGYCPRLRAIFPRLWRAAPLAGSMRRTCRKASSYVPVDMGAMLQRWKPFPETRVPATGVLQQSHTPRHPPERRPPISPMSQPYSVHITWNTQSTCNSTYVVPHARGHRGPCDIQRQTE
jgi:hypothetical protein